jgi:mannose-6-phosphate isomerase-like protein (cupin superfamily)
MEFRDKIIELNENEFLIVPSGVEHRPVAEHEVSVILFEPATTLNVGQHSKRINATNSRKNIEKCFVTHSVNSYPR